MEAKLEIAGTDIFDSILASLKEGINNLESQEIAHIVCFGIGKIGECSISRYQFAVILCLKELYKVNVWMYDPVFDSNEVKILDHFGIFTLCENLEGKYKVCDRNVLFYLPHCPKQLTNNLLWANWGLSLSYCIIIANSFSNILEQSSSRMIKANAEYISRIHPYTLELPVINSFKYFEIFNNTAIHFFPKLNLLPQDVWDCQPEPVYLEDVEFVTKSVS